MNSLTKNSFSFIRGEFDTEGRHSFRLFIEAERGNKNDIFFFQEGKELFAYPAYDLINELASVDVLAKFIRVCHAPSCGQRFYTRRKAQVTCTRARARAKEGRPSDCKTEWDAYRAYLAKLALRDDKVTAENTKDRRRQKVEEIIQKGWQDSARQKQFLNQYEPRGPQTSSQIRSGV